MTMASDAVVIGICHAMNDRLAGLQGILYVARQDGGLSAETHDALRAELDRMAELVHDLRRIPLERGEVVEPVMLSEVLREVSELLRHVDEERSEAARRRATGAPAVRAKPATLRRVLLDAALAGDVAWRREGGEVRIPLAVGDGTVAAAEAAGLVVVRPDGAPELSLPSMG